MPRNDLPLGKLVREARLDLEMSQEEVSEGLGITPQVYGRIERGLVQPRLKTLRALCELLSLSADPLLGLPTEPTLGGSRPGLRRLLLKLKDLSDEEVEAVAALIDAFIRRR